MAMVVAIDGPAGAGKSTIARQVAKRCGLTLVDTGAIYRSLALAATTSGVSFDDEDGLARIAGSIKLEFVPGHLEDKVLLEGEDVTRDIRQNQISSAASRVSRHPAVRDALLELQRSLGRAGEGSVLEGRDIGTVVFPDADLKVFLTASAEERARRRAMELDEREQAFPYEIVLEEIRARDRLDTERDVAPLKQAEDAVRIDSSNLTLAEVIDQIVELVEMTRGGLAA